MIICPVAIAIGCKKCPIFKVCPVKSVIGDAPSAEASAKAEKPVAAATPAARAKAWPRRRAKK